MGTWRGWVVVPGRSKEQGVRRVPRLDLTTALFLDLRHSSSELPQWESLTTRVPAALREIALAPQVATHVAQSHGSEVPRDGDVITVDEAAYPTIRYAAASAHGRGCRC
jgi:hypothetical protein